MDRQKMDQQVEQIFEQARRHIVEQASCHQAKNDLSRPLCPHCRSRTLLCDSGQVDLRRTRWCDACKASFFPLDNSATVAGYPVTPNAILSLTIITKCSMSISSFGWNRAFVRGERHKDVQGVDAAFLPCPH